MQMPFLLPVVNSIGICVEKLITSILSWARLQIYARAQKSLSLSKEKRKKKKITERLVTLSVIEIFSYWLASKG